MLTKESTPAPYIFTYNGIQYDVSQFRSKHPGGSYWFDFMKEENKNFTEIFKALHSHEAEKMLLGMPQVGKSEVSKETKRYLRLYEKVKHLEEPNWAQEIFYVTIIAIAFAIGIFVKGALLSIFGFAVSQISTIWVAHSMIHSRKKNVNRLGRIIGCVFGGLTKSWWISKHTVHHIFTNCVRYDEDIDHSYTEIVYPFLFLKWRMKSVTYSLKNLEITDLILLFIHYFFIYRQKWLYLLVGVMIGGFYSSFVMLGNHEQEKRFRLTTGADGFLNHQMETCKNYTKKNFLWVMILGGLNCHFEHHLFPQIPFYYLERVKNILEAEGVKATCKGDIF